MDDQQQHGRGLALLVAGVALLMIVGGVYYLSTRPEKVPRDETPEPQVTNTPPAASQVQTYTLDSGLSFKYPSTYVAISPEMLELMAEETVTLFDKDDYEDLQNSTEPREGPISITVQVFDNPNNDSAGTWITEQASSVNYDADLGRLQPREVGSEDGVAYRFTGLYEGDATAFAHGGKIYLFSVTWMGPNDAIRSDFEDVLSSIRF